MLGDKLWVLVFPLLIALSMLACECFSRHGKVCRRRNLSRFIEDSGTYLVVFGNWPCRVLFEGTARQIPAPTDRKARAC